MRPISLELEGLQSYKQRRTIDFTKLGKLGIFGIFGPTGSGKSTILDGIFLALYGVVPRVGAKAGVGAIVNAEHPTPEKPVCKVEFCFGVEQDGVERVCTVSRVFVPTTTGVRCRSARLTIDAGEGEQPTVKDKVRAVNEKVNTLVGLTVDDFKRAVVLPQGEFNKFLRLGSADRARTLERLFGLERFGRDLDDRVKRAYGKACDEVTRLEGKASTFAHATDEALKESQATLKAAKARAEVASAALGVAEAAFKTTESQATAEADLTQATALLATVKAGSAAAEDSKRELGQARAAEALRGTLEDQDKVRSSLPGLQAGAKQALTAAEEAGALRDGLTRSHQDLVAETEAKRPAVVVRRTRLVGEGRELASGVADEEGQVKSLAGELAEASQQLKQQQALLEATTQELEAARVERDTKQARQRELAAGSPGKGAVRLTRAVKDSEQVTKRRQELKDAEQAAEQAQAGLNKATAGQESAAKSLESARVTATKAEADHRQAAQEQADRDTGEALELRGASLVKDEAAVGALERAEADQATADDALTDAKSAADVGQTGVATAAKDLAEADAAKAQAELERDAARETLAAQQTLERAVVLAATLEAGSPCAVCGSAEHPHPASSADPGALAAAEARVPVAEAALTTARVACERTRDVHTRVETQQGQDEKTLEASSKARVDALEVLEGAQANTRGELVALKPEQRAAWLTTQGERLKADKQAREQGEQAVRALEVAKTQADSAVTKLEGQLQTASAKLDAATEKLKACTIAVEGRRKELADAEGVLDRSRADTAIEDLAASLKQAEDLERELKQVAGLLTDLQAKLPQLEKACDALQQDKGKLQKTADGHEANLAAKRKTLDDKRQQLGALTGGEALEPLIKRLELEVSAFDTALGASKDAAEAAGSQAKQLGDVATKAKLAGEQGQARRKQLEQTLADLIARGEGAFADVAAARQALRSGGEVKALAKAVEEHGKALASAKGKLEQATNKAGSERLAPGALKAAEAGLAEAKSERTAAIGARGGQEEAHAKLKEEVELRKSLAGDLGTAELRKERLGTITGLLRGKALVEYVAEEELRLATNEASNRLLKFSGGNFGLELDSNQEFVIRDHYSGGNTRPLASLSGGETFLAALAMALALAERFQARGSRPIRFFFLDEGFGTLDGEKLDVAIKALEDVARGDRMIGVISHVEEVKSRLQRQLRVTPATPDGEGSDVEIVD